MPNVSELISMGYGGYAGWSDREADADFRATGGAGKMTGGGSSGRTSIPSFTFDEKAAETKAMAELAPYYEQLLKFYGGDVALAKQRIDQDYERGLRIETKKTDWEKEDIDLQVQERKRRFQTALKDLDQTMNQRGIFESGIKKQEVGQATAEEQYAQTGLERQKQALDTGLQQFTEGKNVDYQRDMERLGYVKPTVQPATGQFAPNTAGQTSPIAQASVTNFTAEPIQKQVDLEEQRRKDMATKVANQRAQAYEKWAADATRLASMTQY